jgi:predicted ester cyclase
MHATNDDMIAEGDNVVTRQTITGTNQGELMGIPPTGKQINVQQIAINRIVNGKIAETWAIADVLGMMQQLGLAPGP